jgi:hypothetical protein
MVVDLEQSYKALGYNMPLMVQQDSSHLHGQQDNTGLNKERQKSQPPRRRNQEESSYPEQKELKNRI